MMKVAPNACHLLPSLEIAFFERDIATGFRLLEEAFPTEQELDESMEFSVSLLLCVAQWVDLGYRNVEFLDKLAAAYPPGDSAGLSFPDYLKVRRE